MSPADLVRLFVQHRNAGNLLMILALVLGLFSLSRLNTQFFPDFGIDIVSISVVWPGASAEDVEANIILAIEPEVRFLDGVKSVQGVAVEGAATVIIEFEPGADMQKAQSDAEAAVARVTTLPEESEKPTVKRVVRYDPISRLVISGPYPEASIKAVAKRLRDELLDRGIDQITLFGSRDEEVQVEVDPEILRRLDITLSEIGSRIAQSSQDIPSGKLEGIVEKQIRSIGQVKTAAMIGGIELKSLPGGQKVFLRDVARIRDTFEETATVGVRRGNPAVELHIQRATTADALKAAEVVEAYLREVRPTLPPNLRLEQYDVQASLIKDRIELLLRNGMGGLVLVVGILFVFLSGRVAFWVAAGIPVAMLATATVMLVSGQSINMVSLFAMIMTLGIIVDDAIVVGEHASTLRAAGKRPVEAATEGALRMLSPVAASSLTTIAAFVPLLLISDIIGQIISAIPFVVVSVLIASLVECFLILPGHLRGSLRKQDGKEPRFRIWFDRMFAHFRDNGFRRMVEACVHWRYLTLSLALAFLIGSVGLLAGGRVGFVFFPSPETDVVNANVLFAPGTPRKQTRAMLDELERALKVAEEKLVGGNGGLLVMNFSKVGISQGDSLFAIRGDQRGGMFVELVPSDFRTVRTRDFIAAWRQEIRPLPGLVRFTLTERQGGPPGREVDIRLIGGTLESLKAAAAETKALLSRFPGVRDIDDDLPYGKQEVIVELNPRGRAMGFTTESVGRQLRSAFEGTIAKRFARDDEEIKVRVKLPSEAATTTTLQRFYLRSTGGGEVPLSEVVTLREEAGFDRIRRQDGKREVAVTAEVDEAVTTTDEVLEAVRGGGGLAEIARRYGLGYRFAGRAEEQARTLGDMKVGAMIGMAAIYIILAWVFASYGRPLVVMAVIPFGLVGAVIGHLMLDYKLTILSMVALLGLSGILVNNSIILVTTIDGHMRNGVRWFEATVQGTCERLRAVMLTTLTTIGGLLPLMFETSLQAQFLIPMAITIVFGLMVASILVLAVVPAFIGIQEDVLRLIRRLRGGPSGKAASTAG
jgi:multidrug efflux pump subunit AcrB